MNAPFRKPSDRAPARIARLAKLPVFFELTGKPAAVVGGTAGAVWKAELLAAAGAEVTVYAETCDEALIALAESGMVRIVRRAWQHADLAGAAMIVAEAGSENEALALRDAARAAGAPLNVIDKPAFCDFQFGSIVNRSPVVVGISTDGASPILGQAIRRRIETLLPRAIGVWADAAKRLRERVVELIADAGRRRRFWEAFADRAFRAEPPYDIDAGLDAMIADAAAGTHVGHVTLVGAGPGDPEFLTLKAVRALQSADIILFDDLVADGVLDLARREAKRMLVGKRGGRPSCRQADINALMIGLARQGKRVVRLKSGDPMIFGRAGEEVAELRREGIAVDIVPGITAALALAARTGVSLTHRDRAHSVRFVTGHARDGSLPGGLDWRGLADPETSLVVYMGGRTAGDFAARLIAEGLAPATPVACAAGLGRPSEAIATGTLAALAALIGTLDTKEPVLVGIGVVFAAALMNADAPNSAAVAFPRADINPRARDLRL